MRLRFDVFMAIAPAIVFETILCSRALRIVWLETRWWAGQAHARTLGIFKRQPQGRKYAMSSWSRGKLAMFVIVLCVSLLTLGRAVAVEEPSLEECDAECSLALAHELAHAYDQNNPRAGLLTTEFNKKLTILFESGDFEHVVRLVQMVTPVAAKSKAPWILEQLGDWQAVEALARNPSEPTPIVLDRSIAKDEVPLQISVDGGQRIIKADIYCSFNSSMEWIGETPQHIILGPGLTRLVLSFLEGNGSGVFTAVLPALIVDLTLDDGHVRVHDLHYGDLPEPPAHAGHILVLSKNSEVEFISSIRQRYPTSSVLRPKENSVPTLEIPILPRGDDFMGGGIFDWGARDYRKIQIESDPIGASILINGQPRGATPRAILSRLSKIRIILSKPGYLETAAEIQLTEPVTVIHSNLNPMP